MFFSIFTPERAQRERKMSNKLRFAILLLSLLALTPPYAIPLASATQAAQEEGTQDERIHQ